MSSILVVKFIAHQANEIFRIIWKRSLLLDEIYVIGSQMHILELKLNIDDLEQSWLVVH